MADRIEYVDLDRALHGDQKPDTLNTPTRAEYNRITAEGPVKKIKPGKADKAQDKLWAEVRELEAAAHAVAEQHGHGSPELDQWITDIRTLGERKRRR